MRIISGKYRSRRLDSPPGLTTRPLPDRVRTSLFNLLREHFVDAAVLDCFAGTGSFGLEAASIGASRVVLVEQNRRVAQILQGNVDRLGAGDVCEVVVGDALGTPALSRCPRPVHIVMMDPPYPLVKDREGWERVRRQAERLIGMLDDTGYLLLRTPWPFWHLVLPEGAEPTPPARRGKDGRGGKGRAGGGEAGRPKRREVIAADSDEAELDAIDALEAELAAAHPGATRVPADLSFPNAEGPETHVYKNTAVHFYMRADRARPGPEPAEAGSGG